MPTKIETHLSPEQLMEFLDRCAQTKGAKRLASIQALAEEFGVSISLMSASAFRDGPLDTYLAELKSKREMAEQVSEVAKSGLALSDAAASVLSQKIFDQALRLDASGKTALDESNTMSLALSRLRLGDQRAKLLERNVALRDEQIAKLAREKTEWEEERSKIRATAEAAGAAINKPKATPDEIRAQTVALIDEIMGIKPKSKKA